MSKAMFLLILMSLASFLMGTIVDHMIFFRKASEPEQRLDYNKI